MIPRTIAIIQAQIVSNLQTNYGTQITDPFYRIFNDANGNPITPSQSNAVIVFTFLMAVAISIFEQTLAIFQSLFESELQTAVIGSAAWLRDQILKFQYSSTIPQVISLVNFIPTYPVVNPSLCIVSAVSIVTLSNGSIQIKVAKTDPTTGLLTALDNTTELPALQAYINTIMPLGINTTGISVAPDQIVIAGDIYYNGQYNSVIVANVQQAITNFIDNIVFDGTLFISELEDAILAVTGVNDIKINSISCRPDSVAFVAAGNIIVYQLSTGVNSRKYQPFAGYMITETTTAHTITDTLNFIPGN